MSIGSSLLRLRPSIFPSHHHSPSSLGTRLDVLADVAGHLLDLGGVELLDLLQLVEVCGGDEVDGHSLASVASRSADAI